jgi:uncharacterized protein (DUF2235 family)
MKRLIVCCDGTWNRADQPAVTNVCKLYEAIADADDAGAEQRAWYEEGVGARRWKVLGGGFGIGLSENVQDCYRWLVDNYEPGDELFFLGFSRGAFTARSLGGLVRNSGILRAEHRGRIEEAYKLYRSPKDDKAPSGDKAEAFRDRYSHPEAEIRFVGVWDTVGALGIPIDGFRPPLLSRLWTFHDTTLSRVVRDARHAIAIDERRRPFSPTLWVKKVRKDGTVEQPPPRQVVKQVWFAGVHSDVGGGYPDRSLSDLPLRWMAKEAQACGLKLDPGTFAPNALGELHDSMTTLYRLLRPYDRKLACRDGEPIGVSSLASSARTRHEGDATYVPPGLQQWLAQGRDVVDV